MTALQQEAEQAYDEDRDHLLAGQRYGYRKGYITGAASCAQRIKELEDEGVAVVRLLHDIDAAGGFVTELARELSDRIDAVLEGD